MDNRVYFVSLGPGEAELITIKGLNTLRGCDIIFAPATIVNNKTVSRCGDILSQLGIDNNVKFFTLPMNIDREMANEVYDKLAWEAYSLYLKGCKVAFVAEGDSGFYSSIHYIQDRLEAKGVEIYRVAGVPAFIAAGAFAGVHVAKLDEQLLVIPGKLSYSELREHLLQRRSIVIMKLSLCREVVKRVMLELDGFDWFYIENVGTERECYLNSKNEILSRDFPYFSLMIIKPR